MYHEVAFESFGADLVSLQERMLLVLDHDDTVHSAS